LLFGILSVLGPLRLSDAGWGAAAIGAIWLTGAALEGVASLLVGRLIDRRGSLLPVRVALATGTVLVLGLAAGPAPVIYAALIALSAAAFGILFTPAFALIAQGAENVALPQGMAFGFMSAAWATGAFVGPGGRRRDRRGDRRLDPVRDRCALCAIAYAFARPASDHVGAAVVVDRLPRDTAGVRGK
jgi:hypothetical protein